jgi:hypothetical protein
VLYSGGCLQHLPIIDGNTATQVHELASTSGLTAEFYPTTYPSQGQISSVR